MERTKQPNQTKELVKQVKAKVNNTSVKQKKEYEGNTEIMVSTGSTLLDLAISGGRIRGGGAPSGILIEVFGPSQAGKTVMLCEMAGDVQRKGGSIMFRDPEARLNKQFAQMFDLDTSLMDYGTPNTIPELFKAVRDWKIDKTKINGVFADSLAALSTDMEMDNDEGDKMGMRRAKEFSEELRRTCRIIKENNLLMVASNQVRQNMDAGKYDVKYSSPGGMGIGFYSSLRLRASNPSKIPLVKKIAGKDVTRIIGVETKFEVFKSSIWKPFHSAIVPILFDYGVDNTRGNLQFIKDNTGNKVYTINGRELSNSMEKSIRIIEEEILEKELENQVINLWEELESAFDSNRIKKRRVW